jgi:hypothetical protein
MTLKFLVSSNSLKDLKKFSILFQATKQKIEILQSNKRYLSKFSNHNSIYRENQNLLIRNSDFCINYRQQSSQTSKPKLRGESGKSFSVNQNIHFFRLTLKFNNLNFINSFYHGNR